MGLVTNITERHEIPHDPDQWIEFRKLSGSQLRESRRKRQLEAAELLRAYGGDLMQAMRGVDRDELAEKAADPLNDLHVETTLGMAIVSWSFPEAVKGNAANLDEPTEQWAMQVIGKMSGVVQETEDERGNDISSSAAT